MYFLKNTFKTFSYNLEIGIIWRFTECESLSDDLIREKWLLAHYRINTLISNLFIFFQYHVLDK